MNERQIELLGDMIGMLERYRDRLDVSEDTRTDIENLLRNMRDELDRERFEMRCRCGRYCGFRPRGIICERCGVRCAMYNPDHLPEAGADKPEPGALRAV